MSKKKKIGRGARLVLALRKFDAWFMGRNYYFRALVVIGAMAEIQDWKEEADKITKGDNNV